jgi:hypothetical protein
VTWSIHGLKTGVDLLGSLEPSQILYDFDGPKIFAALAPNGRLLLAYQCDYNDTGIRLLVVPTSDAALTALRNGTLAVRDALSQPWAWLAEQSHSGEVTAVWEINVSDLPDSALPRPNVALLPEHAPLLTVHMQGEGLIPGRVPGSVVRRAVAGASDALKDLFEWVLAVAPSSGRPEERLRRLYDLPVKRLVFSSVEISFAEPPRVDHPDLFEEEKRAIGGVSDLLTSAVEWATSDRENAPSGDALTVALTALKRLAPPKHGSISEVTLSGRLLGASYLPRTLTRDTSARIRTALKSRQIETAPYMNTGIVREFDKDKLTAILRDPALAWEQRCSVPVHLYDDLFAAFEDNEMVTVLGRLHQSRGIVEVVSLERVTPPDDQSPEASSQD